MIPKHKTNADKQMSRLCGAWILTVVNFHTETKKNLLVDLLNLLPLKTLEQEKVNNP